MSKERNRARGTFLIERHINPEGALAIGFAVLSGTAFLAWLFSR